MLNRGFTAVLLILLCASSAFAQKPEVPKDLRLKNVPANASINVAFVISDGATVIDFAGPWDVFESAMTSSAMKPVRDPMATDMIMPFNTYIVAEKKEAVQVSNGMLVVPNYTFENAPKPQVVVIPAQGSRTPAFKAWLTKVTPEADVVFSVCMGSMVLGEFGMLDGKQATAHEWYRDVFTKGVPKATYRHGVRYVENNLIATAGGETSGIDLSLHIVARYLGDDIAQATADFMMYRGNWKDAGREVPESKAKRQSAAK